MSTYNARIPDVSGVPIREITPSTIQGNFFKVFAVAPDLFYICPGNQTDIGAGQAAWPLYTRSVLSWSISLNRIAGGSLEILIAHQQILGVLQFKQWQMFGITSDVGGVAGIGARMDTISGLELPAGEYAQFILRPGDGVNPQTASGCLTLRGV